MEPKTAYLPQDSSPAEKIAIITKAWGAAAVLSALSGYAAGAARGECAYRIEMMPATFQVDMSYKELDAMLKAKAWKKFIQWAEANTDKLSGALLADWKSSSQFMQYRNELKHAVGGKGAPAVKK